MPRFVSTITNNRLRKLLYLCSHLSAKRPLHPSNFKNILASPQRLNKISSRSLNSACLFIPAELEGSLEKKWWQQFPAKFSDPVSGWQRFEKELNQYDELQETIVDRKCGLPFPSMLRRRRNLELLNAESQSGVWQEQQVALGALPSLYLQLAKSRLSTLVVVTSLGGYAAATAGANWDLTTLLACTLGVYATAFSANAFNQCLEVPYDSQMKRTQQRVLPRGALSTAHAATFALASGSLGVAMLYFGANPLTAALGLGNILLYTLIYTPMKRYSVYNTWIGSLVGAVPPLMGYAACGGSLDGASVVLAAVLFAWQFPHFNALSWNLRADYAKAGYRMMAVCRPDLLKRTSLTYTLALLPLCSIIAPLSGLTDWSFSLASAPLNLHFALLAWRFYQETDSRNSKKLFRCSLVYLPVLMTLMLLCRRKKEEKEEDKFRKIVKLNDWFKMSFVS